MKKLPILHIITPVYNEGDNFPRLYKQVCRYVKTPFRLVVVYDFDEDNTVPVVEKYQEKDKGLILHKNTIGRGALNALKSGFDYVKDGPVLIIMADLSDDLAIVDKMYSEYLEGAAVVCGLRVFRWARGCRLRACLRACAPRFCRFRSFQLRAPLAGVCFVVLS